MTGTVAARVEIELQKMLDLINRAVRKKLRNLAKSPRTITWHPCQPSSDSDFSTPHHHYINFSARVRPGMLVCMLFFAFLFFVDKKNWYEQVGHFIIK